MSKGIAAKGSTSQVSPLPDKTNLRSRSLGSKEGNDDESSHYKHDFVGSVLHQIGVALCGGSLHDFCCTCRYSQTLLQRCQQLSYTGDETRDAVDGDTRVVDDRLEGIISAIGCVPIVAQMQWLAHVTCCNTSSTGDESGGTRHNSRHIAITLPDPVDPSASDRSAYMDRYYDALSACPSIAVLSGTLKLEGIDLLDCLLQSYHNSSVSMDPRTSRQHDIIVAPHATSAVLPASLQQCILSSCDTCHLPSSSPSASFLCGMFNQAYLTLDELAYCSLQMYDIDILREVNLFLGDFCLGGGHIGQNYDGPLPLLASSSSSKAGNNDDYDEHGSELNIFLLMCYMICFSGGLQLLTRQFSTYRPIDSLPVTLTRTRIHTRTAPIERTRGESYYQLSS